MKDKRSEFDKSVIYLAGKTAKYFLVGGAIMTLAVPTNYSYNTSK